METHVQLAFRRRTDALNSRNARSALIRPARSLARSRSDTASAAVNRSSSSLSDIGER